MKAALARKDPDAKFEILVQNNPDTVLAPGRPQYIVILVADNETLRLN